MFKRSLLLLCVIVLGAFSFGCNKDKSSDSDAANRVSQIKVEKLPSKGISMAEDYFIEDKPTAIYIFAEWCPVCRRHTPVVRRVADNLKNNIQFQILNYEDVKDFAQALKMEGVPKMMLFDAEGKYVESINGSISEDQLIEELNKLI